MWGALNYHPSFFYHMETYNNQIKFVNDGLADTIVAAIQVGGGVASLIID